MQYNRAIGFISRLGWVAQIQLNCCMRIVIDTALGLTTIRIAKSIDSFLRKSEIWIVQGSITKTPYKSCRSLESLETNPAFIPEVLDITRWNARWMGIIHIRICMACFVHGPRRIEVASMSANEQRVLDIGK